MTIPPVAILCGGLGTRLRPGAGPLPKALVPVNGEPFLSRQLRLLASRGLSRAVLCTGHGSEAIREFAGDGRAFSLEVSCSADGPAPLGTAGAVLRALPLLGPLFFVLYGDSYLTCDYLEVLRSFEQSGARALMTVFRNEGRWVPSNVEIEGGRLLSYDKERPSPRARHVDYGLGLFRADAFAEAFARTFATASPTGRGDLSAVYRSLLDAGELAFFETGERFYEAGSPAGLLDLEAFLSRTEQA